MKPSLNLSAGVKSDPGLERTNNEDNFFLNLELGIFAVVDGVGGHQGGEHAAAIAVQELEARLSRPDGTLEQALREGIAIANNKIYQTAQSRLDLRGMSCVLSAAVVEPGRVTLGHVGDSRVYKIHRGKIQKLTHDHSPIGEREDRGELTELEAMRHLRRNEVYRDVGTEPHNPTDPDFIEIIATTFEPDAALLLCSDGLSDLVPSATLLEVISDHAGAPQEAADVLIEKALEAGGKDNVTVLVVEGPRFGRATVRGTDRSGRHLSMVRPDEEAPTGRLQPLNGKGPPFAATTPPSEAMAASKSKAASIDDIPRPWLARLPGWAMPVMSLALSIFLIGGYLLWQGRRVPIEAPPPVPTDLRAVIRVESGQLLRDAVAGAGPGSIILVAPGIYAETIALKADVKVVSEVPFGATLRPAPATDGSSDPVVIAQGVERAELMGFVIDGGQRPVGIEVIGSDVSLQNLRMVGPPQAAVRIDATSRALLWQVEGGRLEAEPGAMVLKADSPEPPGGPEKAPTGDGKASSDEAGRGAAAGSGLSPPKNIRKTDGNAGASGTARPDGSTGSKAERP